MYCTPPLPDQASCQPISRAEHSWQYIILFLQIIWTSFLHGVEQPKKKKETQIRTSRLHMGDDNR